MPEDTVRRASPGRSARRCDGRDAQRTPRATSVDAVALPETSARFAMKVAAATAKRGHPMRAFGGTRRAGGVSATALLVADSWRRDRLVDELGTGLTAAVRGDGPVLAAVHLPPPPFRRRLPADTADWRTGAGRAADLCRNGHADLAMGVFNATVDRPIDHVLVDATDWRDGGSEYRALVATVRRV